MDIDFKILYGALLIVIYAAERFNTPPTIRTSTTAGRYYAAATVYLLVYLTTFYVFTKYPKLLGLVMELFDINIDTSKAEVGSSDTGLILVALLLSLLVPKIPVISEIDTRLRRFLHRLAAIPYEAIRLSKEIQHSRYWVPSSVRDSLVDELEEQGFQHKTIDSHDPVIQGWVTIISLITQLKAWDHSHQFAIFVQERSGQFERIKEHYARLSRMARNAVALSDQANAQPELKALQDASNKFRSNLHSEQQALLREICDFISHGVLKTCFRYGSRQKMMNDMGFLDVGKDSSLGLSVNQTVMLFGLLLALVLGNFILFRPPDAGGERLLLMVTMIVSIYSAAVICAVAPKQRWSFFQYNQTDYYPTAGYLLSGLMAVITASAISVFFKTLIFVASPEVDEFAAAFPRAWNQFTSESYPWLTMAFVTAVSTAFLIDWRRPSWIPARLSRFLDGVFQAAFLTMAASLVHWWLSSLSASGNFGGRVPDLGTVMRNSAIVGFTLGFFVPTWYWSHTSSEKDAPEAAGPAETDDRATPETPHQGNAVVKHLHG